MTFFFSVEINNIMAKAVFTALCRQLVSPQMRQRKPASSASSSSTLTCRRKCDKVPQQDQQ